ncbi:MAG: hypothetical protein LBR85_07645 [Oscillospiraceae bacterium]|jgi:hypothetical protein|nr:hypothetical protein [Oscillospiraceae bacterium]
MVIIAILTGAASFFNYFWWVNYELPGALKIVSIAVQAVLIVLTVIAAARYRGKRLRASFDRAGYRIFTLPFAVIFASILGNLAVLAVLILRAAGTID